VLGIAGETGAGVMLLLLFVLTWGYPILFEVLWQGQTPRTPAPVCMRLGRRPHLAQASAVWTTSEADVPTWSRVLAPSPRRGLRQWDALTFLGYCRTVGR
jgi:hypothetical protein